MTKRVRVWGVGVFLALLATLAVFWWLFAGWILKRAVEETGTNLVGARVELASADIGLMPLAVTLHGLQITNPDEPMTNALEVRRIAAGIDVAPLLRRKVLIDELAIEGVRFGTERDRSGAIEGGPLFDVGALPQKSAAWAQDATASLELPPFETPNIDDILANEELESLAVIEDAKKAAETVTAEWKQRLDDLPDQAKFEAYRDRLGKLGSSGGIAGALMASGEVLSLQKEVQADLDVLEAATGDLQAEVGRIQELAERAAAAPAKDVQRLQEKYGLSKQGLANLSRRLLGPKIGQLVARALSWWDRIEPLVSRARGAMETGGGEGSEAVASLRGGGINVRFRETNPQPDFLVRRASVSVQLEVGDVSGSIEDITPDQPVHGKPLTFTFAADELKGVGRVALVGLIDRVAPDASRDEFELQLDAFEVKDATLSESEQWGLVLSSGTLDLSAKMRLAAETMTASIDVELSRARLATSFVDEGVVADAIARTLEGVSDFALQADVRGDADDYTIEVHSDLDRLLGRAVTGLVGRQMAQLKTQLTQGIAAKTRGPLAGLQGGLGGLGGLGGIEQEIGQRLDLGGGLLVGGGEAGGKSEGGKQDPSSLLNGLGIKGLPF